MKISIFRAASMPAAMAELRAALGENAVILQTRQVGRGVEITAAADAEDDEPWLVKPEATDWRKPEPTDWRKLEATDWRKPEATGSRKPGGGGDGKPEAAPPPTIAPLPSGAPIFLVGMPGAGKTLTCVKLATRFVLAGTGPKAWCCAHHFFKSRQ